MKKIAVIGLGIMGHAIADNYLKNGYEVVVWNRHDVKAKDLVKRGARAASSPKDAAKRADIIFEVTANDESSKEVWVGENSILIGASPGKILITNATLSPAWTDELAKECVKLGFTFFDMPMTGGRPAAEAGQLTLLVGGSKQKLEKLKPDLKAIAKTINYFGPVGSGMRYKLILNYLQAVHIAGFAEALKMAKEAGLDLKPVGEALNQRPGGVVTELAWQGYQKQPDPIMFSVEWINKDLNYAAKMTKDSPHPLLHEMVKQYGQAVEEGYAKSDWTKLTQL